MSALAGLTVGMSAEENVIVTREMTIGHFVPWMPGVYATPMMVLHIEVAAGSAIASALPAGFVSVGMEVNVRIWPPHPLGAESARLPKSPGSMPEASSS